MAMPPENDIVPSRDIKPKMDDIEAILDVLMSDGMDRDEAIEWFEYNTESAWFGDGTPVYLVRGSG